MNKHLEKASSILGGIDWYSAVRPDDRNLAAVQAQLATAYALTGLLEHLVKKDEDFAKAFVDVAWRTAKGEAE